MLFEPGFDHGDWAQPAPTPLDGDGGPATGGDWLAAAFDRPFGRLTDLTVDARPPVMPEGFDLDFSARKEADGFVMFGDEPPETEVDPIIVEGGGWRPPTAVSPGWGDGPQEPPVPGGGGGGGAGSDPDTTGLTGHDSMCGATGAIRAAINGLSTNNDVEHVAIVFRGADGRLYNSPPFEGVSGSVDWYELSVWMQARGVGFEDVIGLYHNHDRHSSDNPDPDYHRYPSNQNTVPAGEGHDWLGAEAFVRAGADPSQFRLLIEDQDGNVRSFSYSDMDRYATMTKEEMEDREDLPPVTNGCGS